MARRKIVIGIILFLCALAGKVSAQYVVSGAAPLSLRWKQLKSPYHKVIFPDYYLPKALLVNAYLDTIRPFISYGLKPLIDKIPVVLYPTNLHSNGLVTWAPRRVELYTAPPADNFAVPWLKQLAVHEYRHVVQMSNLNVGFTRVASYLVGEQLVGVVAMVPPRWFFEGDAVAAETELTAFGRGKQPEFSIEYRAMVNEDPKLLNLDKWICGSWKENIPDRYKLGYQVVTAARSYYGEDFWEKVIRYCGRNPFLIVSPNIAYRKYAKTDTRRLLERTFGDLKAYWHAASSVPNSSAFLDTVTRSYTTYQYPLDFGGGKIVAQKKDMDAVSRFVLVDTADRSERLLRYNRMVSSRPALRGDMLLWTEYRPSLFWEQKNRSVVRAMRLERRNGAFRATRPRTIYDGADCYFITPMGDAGYAMVIYDRLNNPSVVLTDSVFRETGRIVPAGDDISVNGLAWDDRTGRLFAIVLDDAGMYIAEADRVRSRLCPVTLPSYVTVANLQARGGKLWFNSIASGKDEAHCLDLASGKEYRATTSKYGTVMPAPFGDSTIVAATYRRNGYLLSTRRTTIADLVETTPSKLPVDLLNPPRKSWGYQIDTVNITAAQAVGSNTAGVSRYSRFGHLFRVHSWIPISVDVQQLVDEHEFDLGIGVTGISQNTLGSMVSILQYGWLPRKHSNYVMANFTYTGLPVHIGLDVEYGGNDQTIYRPVGTGFDGWYPDKIRKQMRVSAELSVPMDFSDGSNSRYLTPFVSFNYYNAIIYDSYEQSMRKGNYKMTAGLIFANYRYTTFKELNPRLGYLLRLSYTLNPLRQDFGRLLNFYARGYLPGLANLHSLTLEANAQVQRKGYYNYLQKTLYPKGCYYEYASHTLFSAAASYKFPLAFPDGGIPNVLYFKRISMDLFGQYARNALFTRGKDYVIHPYTYGGELLFDLNVLRIGVDFSIGVSVYKPSDHRKPMCGLSVGFGF